MPDVTDGAEGGAGFRRPPPYRPHAAARETVDRRPSGAGCMRMAMNLGPF